MQNGGANLWHRQSKGRFAVGFRPRTVVFCNLTIRHGLKIILYGNKYPQAHTWYKKVNVEKFERDQRFTFYQSGFDALK